MKSHFSLLHYTSSFSAPKDGDGELNTWDKIYRGGGTCRERMSGPFAFPFHLADLARDVPMPVTATNRRSLLQTTTTPPPPPPKGIPEMATDVDLSVPGKATFRLDGQLITVDLGLAGNSNTNGLGLIDITASNARDAYTGVPLDEAAAIRWHAGGYAEIIRTTFYVGDRARFFFIAGSNCKKDCPDENCDGPMDITYKITFTNGYNWYDKHFSADEIGVLETMFAFTLLQVILCVYFLYIRRELRKVNKFHHTVKMLGASVCLALLAHGAFLIHYFVYSTNGIGLPYMMFVGRLIQAASETLFLLLLILVAKGWTICCRKISARGRVKIAVFGTVYSFVWITVCVVYYFYADNASTLHIYQSLAGYILCGLRGFGLHWFLYSVYVTLRKYNSKVNFYHKFVAAFSLWFIGLPITVGVAHALDPWIRFVIVNAMDYTFLYVFQFVLLNMYNPSVAFNKNFPFHATTLDTIGDSRPRMLIRKPSLSGGSGGGGGGDDGGDYGENADDSSGAGAHGGQSRMKSFGNTVFQKNVLSSKWDKDDFKNAMHHARVIMREGELLMQRLESIEASNDSDDEAYELPGPNNTYGGPSLPRPSASFGGGGMGASIRLRAAGGGGAGSTEPKPVSGMGATQTQSPAGFQAPSRVFGNNSLPRPPPQQHQQPDPFGGGDGGGMSTFGGGGGGVDQDEEGGYGSQSLGGTSNRSLMSRMGKSKSRGGGYT